MSGLHQAFDTASDDRVAADGAPAIPRKPRLVMRDPQQRSSVSAFELESFPSAGQPGSFGYESAHSAGVIEQARRTAESMLEQTRAACEADREAARAAGYEAGYAAGMEAADDESAALIRTAEQIALHVASERERLLAASEADLVDLAIVVAGKLVNAEIEVRPELVVEVCRGAMRKAFQRETLVVRAHPEDLELLRSAGPQLAAELGGVEHLQFVEERRVPRGSLIVRTPAGEIDATFAGKSEKLAEALRELAAVRAAEQRTRDAA